MNSKRVNIKCDREKEETISKEKKSGFETDINNFGLDFNVVYRYMNCYRLQQGLNTST